jgi:O-antigen ligase
MAKLAKPKKKKENVGKEITGNLLEYVTAFAAVILCIALPLYRKEGYYQIGTAKYNAYAHLIVYAMPLLLFLILLYICFMIKEKGIHRQGFCNVAASLSVTDRFVAAFLILALISFAASGDWKEAWWGYDGWYMGLFSQLSFVFLYFVYSRFGKNQWIILASLLATAFYTYVIAILHRLLIDPIGVYEGLDDYYKNQFLSTLGQASWYSSFLCTVLPIGIFCFWYGRRLWLRALGGIFTFVGFASLVTQNTDSAYFAFAAVILTLFFVSVRSADYMKRFFEVIFLFFLAAKFMYLLLLIHPNEILELDTISELIVFDNRMWILVFLSLLGILFFALLDKKQSYPARLMKTVMYVLFGAVVLLVAAWALILLIGTKGSLPPALSSLTEKIPYLTWSSEWGNGRGFTWSVTAKMLSEMNLFHRFFGVGPDCYASYGYQYYEELIRSQWGNNVLTNAHNEWLNMLVNYGIFGAAAYIGIFITELVRFVRGFDKRPVVLGFALSIAAYMAHNIFCYQQVLCTPFVFLFMALGEWQLREAAGTSAD